MASLSQVARQAGVSASTVSRYFRGQLSIKTETAEKIRQAANELGYSSPSFPLDETTETKTPPLNRPVIEHTASPSIGHDIALIVPELTNPFYASLCEAIAAQAQAGNHTLEIMVSGRQPSTESRLVNHVIESKKFDGLIYAGMHRTNRALNHLATSPIRLVLLDEDITIPTQSHPNIVTVDNYSGAYQATSYLISLGHRRIAHIAGPTMLSTTTERLRGYQAALENAGIPYDPQLVFSGPYTEEYGASVLTYLTQPENRPTAVFAGSDIVAIGLISVCKQYGISIPQDLSVVGCDGIRTGKWLRPSLTTLTQPIDDMAIAALNLLFRDNDEVTPSKRGDSIRLPLTLTIRESAVPRNE
ncbi:LacI family DNA-binding transcriptional regulator [Bifidobacterium sp. SMB2]|uniref:LacI family DNA-binding transcriptional regulator n=1 Tax=Bifidobacterium saimiriisciurei TaxID=2661627 RepID=A0ABX0C9P5_9BIFI|nr:MULTISPECIES: LacI family DNA-binding transcriptional regulator [Bifidobacterium]NEG96331.1 LacI family DNA-binding transcriptional regulator [Bifidobacterium sp. SMB2]NEH11037.1 LacI family DNA-binding transcriptional regulator [Bifidobacterium saimiriisciurei]